MPSDITVEDGDFEDATEMLKAMVDIYTRQFVQKGGELIASNAQSIFISGQESLATDDWRSDAWPIPTSRSGRLARSIRVVKVGKEGSYWVSQTGPTVKYGRRVELGYPNPNNTSLGGGHFPYYPTRSFPFMQPGLEKSQDHLSKLYASMMQGAQEA